MCCCFSFGLLASASFILGVVFLVGVSIVAFGCACFSEAVVVLSMCVVVM